MREILFRGKCKIDGGWVYGCIFRNKEKTELLIRTDTDDYPIKLDSLGQYTGLKDKNDTKIFENGYLIIDKQTYKVAFNNGEYILANIFNCDVIQLKNNSSIGVFVDEI